MDWISIADKKPDNASPVLVYYHDDEVAVAQYVNGEFIVPHCASCDSGWSAYRIDDVSHWMPLPKRPKEFEED